MIFTQQSLISFDLFAGKSSFGDMVPSILQDCDFPFEGPGIKLILVTTLGNGTSISDVIVGKHAPIPLVLAARILRTALLPNMSDAEIQSAFSSVGITGPKGAIMVVREAAIQAKQLPPNAALFVVLVVDEVQRLLEEGSGSKQHLRSFILLVGQLQAAFHDQQRRKAVSSSRQCSWAPHLTQSMLLCRPRSFP